MKKQIAAILAALMLATVLLSCHSADTGQKADENPKTEAAAKAETAAEPETTATGPASEAETAAGAVTAAAAATEKAVESATGQKADAEPGIDAAASADTKSLRILATSDLHGRFYPWDYALNEKSTSGSMAQLATAIAEKRKANTILVDGGDTIQDNSSEIFFGREDVYPMIQALNALNYDVGVTGNHEYNYGIDVVRKAIADFQGKVLTGNVYDTDGSRIADGWTIIDVDGVRVARRQAGER